MLRSVHPLFPAAPALPRFPFILPHEKLPPARKLRAKVFCLSEGLCHDKILF